MKMQMLVKNDLSKRGDNKTITLDVDPDDTIFSVMAQIEDATGFPPIVQMITSAATGYKTFFHSTPGTLADNKLVPPASSPDTTPASVTVISSGLTWTFLRAKIVRSMGFLDVDDDADDKELDPSELQRLAADPGQKILISVTDYVRTARAGKVLVMAVEVSLKEEVRRRRRYPVDMQLITVRDAGSPSDAAARRMDRLDATLADYDVKKDSVINLYMSPAFAVRADREERGKVFNKADDIFAAAAPGEQEQVSNSGSSPPATTKSDPAGYLRRLLSFPAGMVGVFIAMVVAVMLFYLV